MGVKLNWDDQSDQNLDRIEIYRSAVKDDTQKPGNLLATLPATATSYEDLTVKNKNLYYYRIAAVKGTEYAWGEPQLAGYFSETGPGRATPRRGDWNAGIMDRVPVANFITGPDLRLKAPELATFGTAWNMNNWYKMVHKGKIIFVPDTHIVSASWNELYNAGMVFGTDDVGQLPAGPAGSKNQRYVININGLEYILRLPRLSALPTTQYLTNTAGMVGSEWKDCISRLVVANVNKDATARTRLYDQSTSWSALGPHLIAATGSNVSRVDTTNSEILGAGVAQATRFNCMLVLELIMP